MRLLLITLLAAISYAQTDYERCFIREPNKSCAYTMDINIGDNGNRFTVGTEAKCAEVCWAHEDCVAFNYVHQGRHSGGYQGTGTGTCYYRSGQLANQHHSDVRSCHVRDPACDPSAPVSEVQCDSGISGETTDDEHSATYAFTADQADYVFDTCGTDWDTMLTILDSNGDELFFNDDHESACPDGNNQYASHLEAQLTSGSQYTLKINGYCATCYGAYTINVACPETEVGVRRGRGQVHRSQSGRGQIYRPSVRGRGQIYRPSGRGRVYQSDLELEEAVGTSCNWVVQNYNTNGEKNIGEASSPEECIQMVKEQCPDFTIANLPKTGSGSCWCQKGNDMREDTSSSWQTCLLSTITTTTTTTTTTKAPDTYQLTSGKNRKCEITGDTEHKVKSRAECEEEAVNNDAPYYSYSEENTKCFYSTTCDNPRNGRRFPWKIYKRVQGEQTAAFEVIGTTENAITLFAFIGALTVVYYGVKGVHKMMFATSDFQEINENEIEC